MSVKLQWIGICLEESSNAPRLAQSTFSRRIIIRIGESLFTFSASLMYANHYYDGANKIKSLNIERS